MRLDVHKVRNVQSEIRDAKAKLDLAAACQPPTILAGATSHAPLKERSGTGTGTITRSWPRLLNLSPSTTTSTHISIRSHYQADQLRQRHGRHTLEPRAPCDDETLLEQLQAPIPLPVSPELTRTSELHLLGSSNTSPVIRHGGLHFSSSRRIRAKLI